MGLSDTSEPEPREHETPAKDEPVRAKSLMEIFPNLDFNEFYPSLHDVKPVSYIYCSTPQNKDKDADLKQIKSQTYTSDSLSAIFATSQQIQ